MIEEEIKAWNSRSSDVQRDLKLYAAIMLTEDATTIAAQESIKRIWKTIGDLGIVDIPTEILKEIEKDKE